MISNGVWVRERLVDGVYVDDYVDDYSSSPKGNEYDDQEDYDNAFDNWIVGKFRDKEEY